MSNEKFSDNNRSGLDAKYSNLRNTLLGDEGSSEDSRSESSSLLRSIRSTKDDGSYQSFSTSPSIRDPQLYQYGHTGPLQPTHYAEKALEVLLKSGLAYVLSCLAGVALIALKFEGVLGPSWNWWVVFSPIWIGNVIVFIGHILSFKATMKLRSFSSMEMHSNEPHLPLLRRIGATYAVSVPLLLLLLWSELAFCSRLQNKNGTSIYFCYTPIMIIHIGFVSRYLLCKSESYIPGILWVLSSFFVTLLAYKTNQEYYLNSTPQNYVFLDIPWWLVLSPLFAFDTIMLGCLVALICFEISGIYRLASWQRTCCILYGISLALMISGQLLLWKEIETSHNVFTLPSILIFSGIVFGSIAVYIVCLAYVVSLMSSKGGAAPVPLTKTSSGWIASGAIMDRWLLIGDIYLGTRGLEAKKRFLRQRTQSEVETDRFSFFSCCCEKKSNQHVNDTVPEQRLQHTLKRSTSGSYHDISVVTSD